MPFTYSIDIGRNLVRQTLWGKVDAEDLHELTSAMWRDPQYRGKMNILVDVREAQVNISYDGMVQFARFLLSNKQEMGKQAIVVRRQLEFGIARMFEQLTAHNVRREDLKVFLDVEAAEHWLGCKSAPSSDSLLAG
jgi:SpoIIAA-like